MLPYTVPFPSRRAPEPVRSSVRLVERVESASRILRRPRRPSVFETQGRRVMLVSADGGLVASAAPSPAQDERLLNDADGRGPTRFARRMATHEIRLAKLGGGGPRLRAFYPEQHLAAAVHGRVDRRPSRLARAATVLTHMQNRDELVVPVLREHGSSRGADWLLEEMIHGRHPRAQDRPAVAQDLMPRLLLVGHGLGWERRPVGSVLGGPLVGEVIDLLGRPPRADDDPLHDLPLAGGSDLVARVTDLVGDAGAVVTALGHGDPVISNVLQRADGAMVLLDWELADRLPLGHDVAKLVLGDADPLTLVAVGEPLFAARARPGDLPWSRQVAVGVMRTLGGWRQQEAVAASSGRSRNHQRSLARRLRLLADLLGQ